MSKCWQTSSLLCSFFNCSFSDFVFSCTSADFLFYHFVLKMCQVREQTRGFNQRVEPTKNNTGRNTPSTKKKVKGLGLFFGMEWTAPRPLLCFFMDFVSAFQIFWLSELTDFFYDFPLFLFITKGNQKAALLIGNSFGTSFNEFLLARKLIAVARIIYFCIQKFRNRQQKWDFKKSLNFMSVLRTEKGLV